MYDVPILLLGFNRPDTIRQVFEKIRSIKPLILYIAVDGARSNKPDESTLVTQVKDIVTEIDWPCTVKKLFRFENVGCKIAVSGAIKWFFSEVEMGIVLEDDCLPTTSFFYYCKTLLSYYKDDNRIGMISGHNYFGKTSDKNNDYSIITTCGVWGWASWRRVIEGYDPNFSVLLDPKKTDIETICFRKDVGKHLLINSLSSVEGKINTWDYQFCEYLIVNRLYTVMPNLNQIRNIGFITSSTHTATPPYWYKDEFFEYQRPVRCRSKFSVSKKISIQIESFHVPLQRFCLIKFMKNIFRKIVAKFNRIKQVILDIGFSILRNMDSSLGNSLRYKYYKKRLKYLGTNVIIDTGVYMSGCEFISIDDNTHIDKNCIIVGSPSDLDLSSRYLKRKNNANFTGVVGSVYIGKDNHISQNCMIYGYGGISLGNNCVMSSGSKIYSLTSMDHNPYNKSEIISIVPYSGKSPTLIGPIVFCDNVWIGLDVIVSPGVYIGENSFVRSRSIVLNSFGSNSYVAGDPAVLIRSRFQIPNTEDKEI